MLFTFMPPESSSQQLHYKVVKDERVVCHVSKSQRVTQVWCGQFAVTHTVDSGLFNEEEVHVIPQ